MAEASSAPDLRSETEAERPETAHAETEYVRDVLDAVESVLGHSLAPEVHELFARTAAVNAVKQSERLTVSSSALFVAAVLWGRLEGRAAPAAAIRLAQAVGQGGFDDVFLDGMLESDFDERLSPLGPPRPGTKHSPPVLSDSLGRMLASPYRSKHRSPGGSRRLGKR